MTPAPLTLYRHYKGGLYVVLTCARLSEERDVEVVVYRSLLTKKVWERPLAMWCERVEVDGRQVPRFELVEDLP